MERGESDKAAIHPHRKRADLALGVRRRKARYASFRPYGQNYTRFLAPPLPAKFFDFAGSLITALGLAAA